MVEFQLKLFGGFIFTHVQGGEIYIANAKERALLAYLALNPAKPLTRSHLAGLLWGEQSERNARHSLSQALSSLCLSLGDEVEIIARGKQKITLQIDTIAVDVADFQSAAKADDGATLAGVVKIFQSGLFSEFEFAEPGFDEWALALRYECHDQAMAAGLAFLSQSKLSDNHETGISVARRLLRLDPTAEPVHQALIRLYIKSGQPGAARKQLDICREVLEEELGITPNPETERLISNVQTTVRGQARAEDTQPAAEQTSDLVTEIPSIVILPLDGPPDDMELAYIGNGLIDDITTELTRYRGLFVISRETAVAYRTGRWDVPAICQRLGVRHALCGGMRRVNDKYRINLRLVDGTTGQSLWSERYNLDREEFCDFPDEIVATLVSSITNWLDDDALAQARRKPVRNWNAFEHVLQGQTYHQQGWYNVRNIFRAIEHFERAIEIDPGCARAYAYLSCAKATPWAKHRNDAGLDPCLDLAQRAIELDPLESEGHRIVGSVNLLRANHELSEQYFQNAEKLNPGHAHILAHRARLHIHMGEHAMAHNYLNRARQLNPLHPAWYWENMALASFVAGDYEATLTGLNRMQYHSFFDRLYGAAAAAYLGQKRQAKYFLHLAKAERPNLSLSTVSYFLPYAKTADRKHALKGLQLAGLGD